MNEKAALLSLGISGGSFYTGWSLTQVNEVLQAISFLVGIVSGCIAAAYYIRKWRRDK